MFWICLDVNLGNNTPRESEDTVNIEDVNSEAVPIKNDVAEIVAAIDELTANRIEP